MTRLFHHHHHHHNQQYHSSYNTILLWALIWILVILCHSVVESLLLQPPRAAVRSSSLCRQRHSKSLLWHKSSSSTSTSTTTVEKLLNTIEEEKTKEKWQSYDVIQRYINQLEDDFQQQQQQQQQQQLDDDDDDNGAACMNDNPEVISSVLERAFGYYDVIHVQPKDVNDDENPVGGKWTRKRKSLFSKILQVKRTFQHLLPTNTTGLMPTTNNYYNNNHNNNDDVLVAEAINVISLEAFFGLLSLTVMLRGDAVLLTKEERAKMTIPLSPLTVRAYFDPPTICISLGPPKRNRILSLQLGPKSSVVLDTSYVDDDTLRIGRGGTSGTRFIFQRITKTDDDLVEAKECFALLKRRPISATKLRTCFTSLSLAGLYMIVKSQKQRQHWFGYVVLTILSTLTTAALFASTGGIEQQQQRNTNTNTNTAS